MDEKALLLELIETFKDAANKADNINRRLIIALITVVITVCTAFTITMTYFVHSYFYADYSYPVIENTNKNENINKNGVD